MSTTSVDGLVSGLNTTQLISQLMQVEAQPQTDLKNKLATEQGVVSAYQSVNTKMSALQTAAEALTQATSWQSLKVTSSSSSVSASATTATTGGQLNFDVLSLAAAHSIRSDEVTGLTAVIADPTVGIDITQNGTTTHIDLTGTSGTLQDVVNAVNAKGMGVTAAAVNVDSANGIYRLQLTSTKTGTASEFTVSGLSVGTAISSQAADAQISVGSGAGAYTVTNSTNTFSGVLPGVTFTVSKVESGVTLTSSSDSDAIAANVKAMIDAANAAISEITKQSAYNTSSSKGGPLTGDYTVRQLSQQIGSSVYDVATPGNTMNQAGVQLDRNGQLTFDQDAFLAEYQTDPAKAQQLVQALATKLEGVAKGATDTTTGSLTLAIQGRNTDIKSLNDDIANWDVRLADRQAALKRQFAAMEVALGQMQQQSNWLAGQITGMMAQSQG